MASILGGAAGLRPGSVPAGGRRTVVHVTGGRAGARRLAAEPGWSDTSARAFVEEHLFAHDDEGGRRFHAQVDALADGLDVQLLVKQIDDSFLPSRIV